MNNTGTTLSPAVFDKLRAENRIDSPTTRMGLALQSTLGHIFAGVDLHLEPEHRQARQTARRAKTRAGRKANLARRSR
jgi:hypothetical protein